MARPSEDEAGIEVIEEVEVGTVEPGVELEVDSVVLEEVIDGVFTHTLVLVDEQSCCFPYFPPS